MAFTITLTPQNLGSRKAVLVTAVFSATGTNELAVTPGTFGLSTIDAALSELTDCTSTTGTTIADGFLQYNRTSGKLQIASFATGTILDTAATAWTPNPKLLLIGA